MNSPRSHPRLVLKLQDALGKAICDALDDTDVVEVMLNPDGKLFVERLGSVCIQRISFSGEFCF